MPYAHVMPGSIIVCSKALLCAHQQSPKLTAPLHLHVLPGTTLQLQTMPGTMLQLQAALGSILQLHARPGTMLS